ncbi:unnamed protein product [Durusdinium trenchii]|uniref:Uncharacterized protein n=2 Tax=Durusdinium trenchii TaxID=1381693 RepID=A0ABP0NRI2_9DINO
MEEPLMVELGRQQKALLMQETEAEWELIFSHEHLAALEQHSELVCTFHRSSQWPITATWQRPGDEPQKYVDDGQLLRALETRVHPPACLRDRLSGVDERRSGRCLE